MNVTQKMVDEILRRAWEYLGLTHEEPQHGPIRIPPGASVQKLAHALVGGWTSKSDLINVFTSALQVVEEEAHRDTVYVLEEKLIVIGGLDIQWNVAGCTKDKEQALEWENEDYDNRCVTPVTPLPPRKNPKEFS